MNLFAFSSKNLTNIWAGIGAQMWAVSEASEKTRKARITASKKMKIGSCGILYCNERKSFTTPFIVQSEPDPQRVVTDIWPEEWVLPFRIRTLGTPRKLLSLEEAKLSLPVLRSSDKSNVSHVIYIHGRLAFTPSKVSEDDWQVFVENLAD